MKKIFFIYLISFSFSFAQPAGSFDTAFGTNGKVSHCLTPGLFFPVFTIQSTGKIVCTANSVGSTNPYLSYRLNTNGSIDTSFNSNGVANLTAQSYIYASAVQSDDKIIVAGSRIETNGHKDFWIARLQANGDIDTSFGTNGIVQLDVGSIYDVAYAVAVTADNKILVGGTAGSVDGGFCLARLNTNGTLDTTFGTNGITTTAFIAGGESEIKTLRLLPDGKILAAGERVDPNLTKNIAMARYLANGTLDTTFGTNGKVATPVTLGEVDEFKDVEILPDGKILALVTNEPYSSLTAETAFLKYQSDGQLDSSFGTNGILNSPIANWVNYNIQTQTDGKIVCAGFIIGSNSLLVSRLLSDGNIDTSFGTNGFVNFQFNTTSDGQNLIDIFNSPTGKMTACGISNDSAGCVGCIRLNEGVLSNEAFDKNNFILYPNPTNGEVFILNNSATTNEMYVEIYTIYGQKIIDIITKEQKELINLSSYAKGSYLVKITTDGQTNSKVIILN